MFTPEERKLEEPQKQNGLKIVNLAAKMQTPPPRDWRDQYPEEDYDEWTPVDYI